MNTSNHTPPLSAAIASYEARVAADNRKQLDRIAELVSLHQTWSTSILNSIDIMCSTRARQRRQLVDKLAAASCQAARDATLVRYIAQRLTDEATSVRAISRHLNP